MSLEIDKILDVINQGREFLSKQAYTPTPQPPPPMTEDPSMQGQPMPPMDPSMQGQPMPPMDPSMQGQPIPPQEGAAPEDLQGILASIAEGVDALASSHERLSAEVDIMKEQQMTTSAIVSSLEESLGRPAPAPAPKLKEQSVR